LKPPHVSRLERNVDILYCFCVLVKCQFCGVQLTSRYKVSPCTFKDNEYIYVGGTVALKLVQHLVV